MDDGLVPRLIAAGVSLTALGDVLWTVLDQMGADTDVSIADPPWFASYVFLVPRSGSCSAGAGAAAASTWTS